MEKEANMTQRRRQTRNSIYHYLYETREFCSKQSLARDLRLSLPTVYQHLTELMEEGLVHPEKVVTMITDLDNWEEGFTKSKNAEEVKVVNPGS